MDIEKSFDVLGRIRYPLELTHDVRAVKAATNVVFTKLLRTVAYLPQKGRICQVGVIAIWCHQANNEWSIIKLLKVGQGQNCIPKVLSSRRAKPQRKVSAVVHRSVFDQSKFILDERCKPCLVVDSVL